MNNLTQVTVVIGAGSIGQAIARRVSAGKHVLLADLRQDNAEAAASVLRHLPRPRLQRFCVSICMARRWCWRRSAR